jgi:hypothetical protein
MFVREVFKKSKTKAKKYVQHHLIESVRTPFGPRQNLILNLGVLTLKKEEWKELANAIEAKINNQASLFPTNKEIECLATHYASLIIRERLSKKSEHGISQDAEEEQSPCYEKVNINSLCTSEARSIGAEHVALNQMAEYGFDNILKNLDFSGKQVDYAKMLIIGRLVHPSSERENVRWLNNNSGTLELLQTDAKVYDTALHRIAIQLKENHEKIEQELSKAAREKFSLKETIVLYDLTNTYFESVKRDSKIAKFGRSKEKRNDCRLVTLALTVDDEGFPKSSKILEGNVSEPDTLEKMLDELPKNVGIFEIERTIVIDAGIATEENIGLIKNRKNINYVAVSRKKSYGDDFWTGSQEQELELSDEKTKIKIKSVRTDSEVFLHVHSEGKEIKEKSILENKLQKFEKSLLEINANLKKKGSQKKYEKIVERVGRLKEKYGVGTLYDVEVTNKDGNAIEIVYSKNARGEAREASVGDYVLRTNRLDLEDEQISKIHRSLTTVEESFRSMKSELGIRPNFHHRDDTSIAHILITVIAYHFLSGILKQLRSAGMNYNWNSIRNILENHRRVTTTCNTEDGHTLFVRTCTNPTAEHQKIYKYLKIKHKPLKRVSLKIPFKKNANTQEKSNGN